MTFIIGKEEPGRLVMGADSAYGTPEEFYVYPHLPKIARCGPYLVGACGSGRVVQILQHCVKWPEPPSSGDLLPFLVHEVAPEILRAAQAGGVEPTRGLFLGDKTVVLIGIRGERYSRRYHPLRQGGLCCLACLTSSR